MKDADAVCQLGMPTSLLDGKTVLLTGGTDGIGAVTARELAKRGATICVTGRDPAKAESVVTALDAIGSGDASSLVADFASLDAVRALAADVRDQFESLDVLINNAGTWPRERVVTDDGLELTFAVNYLAPFVLTHELLPQLRAGDGGRVINVSSGLHRSGTLDFHDLQGDYSWDATAAYRQSKLAMVLFTYKLDRRLEETGVVAAALEPGFIPRTGLYRGFPRVLQWLAPALERLPSNQIRTVAAAAETYCHVATAPPAEISGRYFDGTEPVESAPSSYDAATQRRLWDTSRELAGMQSYLEPESETGGSSAPRRS